jgi:site-specific DNA-cytosine methylase
MKYITENKPSIDEANAIGNKNRDKWRFLTPEECEAINTIPIGYTSGVSNYNRYHAIGNGWTVDVVAHIFKGLK